MTTCSRTWRTRTCVSSSARTHLPGVQKAVSPHPIDSIQFKADIHIHSVSFPLRGYWDEPLRHRGAGTDEWLDIIGLIFTPPWTLTWWGVWGEIMGVHVLMKEEVTAKEEVHCLDLIYNGFLLKNYYLMDKMSIKNIYNIKLLIKMFNKYIFSTAITDCRSCFSMLGCIDMNARKQSEADSFPS